MGNISMMREPHLSFARMAGSYSTQLAGGAGDDTEVTSAWVDVLGNNSSASAHWITRGRFQALDAEFLIQTTLAAAATLQLKTIKFETAPPDGSGDPDAGSVVVLPDQIINYTIRSLNNTPQWAEAQAAAGAAITVATGAVTAGLYVVRFSRVVVAPNVLNFVRMKFTPDLSAGSVDTSAIAQSFGAVSPHMPAEAAVDI